VKKTLPYYINTLKLKSLSKIYASGLLKPIKDPFLIKKLNEIKFPITSDFSSVYVAFCFRKDHQTFANKLSFQDGIAIGEINNAPSYLIPAIYSLILYNDYLCFKDDRLLISFNQHIEFLIKNHNATLAGITWKHLEDIPRFTLKGSWSSGITQGVIASTLLRAYEVGKEERYLELAEKAITFALDKNGPLYTQLEGDMYWIEEYPSKVGQGVLNGYIFFLIALIELNCYKDYQVWVDRGIKTLQYYLPDFQHGSNIKYATSLSEFGNILYQVIHEYQFHHLAQITKQTAFLELKKHWSGKLNKGLVENYMKDQ